MNRKEFLRLLMACLLTPKLKAQYSESEVLQKTEEEMAYILLNFYESPPRWLLDLPLSNMDKPMIPHSMISTKLENGKPVYRTINMGNIKFPSLWENKIQTTGQSSVPMKKILDNMLIIRGCNMNKDGHDLNSRILEASATGKTSIGGRIADNYKAHFPALATSGTMADPYKSVVSSFATDSGLGAFICKEESSLDHIEQVLELYKNTADSDSNTEDILKDISSAIKDSDPISYKKIKELQKLPFSKIFNFYRESLKKYKILLELTYKNDVIKDLTEEKLPGISFPISFKLNEEKSLKPLDYLGAYQFESYILTGSDINQIFRKRKALSIAKNFALAETTLKFSLSNVLILNFDPLTNIDLKDVAPLKDITVETKGDKIIFDCPKKKLFSTPKDGMKMTFDAHFIGTYPALLGYSRYYQHFAAGLFEFKNFLIENKKFNNSLVHLTSEFERAPQLNEAGSDHGWRGHTSTFFSGRFEGIKLIGSITNRSTNALGNLECTWGGADVYPPIKREMRYGDIVASIASFFKVLPTQGGVSLLKYSGEKVVPAFEPQGEA